MANRCFAVCLFRSKCSVVPAIAHAHECRSHTHTLHHHEHHISIFKSSCVIETSDMHKRKPHEKRVEAQASADRWMRVHYSIQAMLMHLYIKYIIQVVFLHNAFHITILTKSCMLAEI